MVGRLSYSTASLCLTYTTFTVSAAFSVELDAARALDSGLGACEWQTIVQHHQPCVFNSES
jgi:hypothetical protein